MKPSSKTTANNNSNNNTNNSTKDVTITTINDHNKVPRVEKVVFDNRIKRKNVLALNEKVAAIREYEKRPVYKRIGRMFHCSPDQIKRIVQQKEAILNAWEQRTRKCRDAKTLEMKVVKVSMLGKAVYEWIRRMMYYKDILITDGLIQKVALQFKSAMGLQNFFPHQEWCDKFRTTYNIPTCDSKTLDIGYTQSHSVQIKDVMKDVLSECSPDPEDNDSDDDDEIDEGEEESGVTNCENDCISIHSDESEMRVKTKLNPNISNKSIQSKTINETPSKSVQLVQHTHLQNIRQLVALPLQTNCIPGMAQKVLVATPIVPHGQKQGTAPMTMTIIPLATLAQPANTLNAATTANTSTTTLNQRNSQNNQDKDQHVDVPSPIFEIKKEIKEEPKDEDEYINKSLTAAVNIKKEYLTDDECEQNVSNKQTIKNNLNTPTHVVAIPLTNKDMIEDSTNDSLDDLTLSTLRKRIKTEDASSEVTKDIERKLSSPPPLTAISTNPSLSKPKEIPPMPPLTKAPNQNNTSATSSSLITTPNQATITLSPLTNLNSTQHKRQRTNESQQQTLPAIRSYTEARKYLKLLEDFALERENFRLIGLITRADEVLRELDRKENNEDEDVDID